LFVNASHSGPFDQRVGSVSTEVSYLLLIVDGADAVAEEDETNNSGVGHLSDSDDVTSFPWDTDGDGTITPLEVLHIVRSVGTNDLVADPDKDGLVTPLEALHGLQRIGFLRNDSVIESTVKTAGSQQSGGVILTAASVAPATPLPLLAASPTATPDSGSTKASVTWRPAVSDDEKTDRLFESTVPDKSDLLPVTTDDFAAVDEGIREVGDWLKAI
jgi:hypothetical protein